MQAGNQESHTNYVELVIADNHCMRDNVELFHISFRTESCDFFLIWVHSFLQMSLCHLAQARNLVKKCGN